MGPVLCINNSKSINFTYANISSGVEVEEAGTAPCARDLLHEHAAEVSRFLTRGMIEMGGAAHPSCPFGVASLGKSRKRIQVLS
jgi:hypothetical protein